MRRHIRLLALVLSMLMLAGPAGAGKKDVEEGPILPPFQENDEGAVFYEAIHEVPGAKAPQLFTQAEKWVGESLDPEVVKDQLADSERGRLTFRTLTRTPDGWRGFTASGDGFIRFEIQLAVKDERVRFRVTDFHFRVADTWGGDGEQRFDGDRYRLWVKEAKKLDKARSELAATLASLSESLSKELAAPDYSDW